MNVSDLVGKKLYCKKSCAMINGPNKGLLAITKGKYYRVNRIDNTNNKQYIIIDNFNEEHHLDRSYFCTEKELRKDKLKKINGNR